MNLNEAIAIRESLKPYIGMAAEGQYPLFRLFIGENNDRLARIIGQQIYKASPPDSDYLGFYSADTSDFMVYVVLTYGNIFDTQPYQYYLRNNKIELEYRERKSPTFSVLANFYRRLFAGSDRGIVAG